LQGIGEKKMTITYPQYTASGANSTACEQIKLWYAIRADNKELNYGY